MSDSAKLFSFSFLISAPDEPLTNDLGSVFLSYNHNEQLTDLSSKVSL